MTEEMKTYGQIAYEAHAEIVERLDPGQAFPAWDDLDAGTMNAWMASGRAVDEQVRTDGIDPGDTRLGGILQKLDNLATGLEMSAATSRPSKKSEIESGCATAIRDIATSVIAPPPDGDALAALAAKWQAEADNADPGLATPRPEASYASRKAAVRQKRICIRQLRQALGVHPLDMAHEDDDDA